MSGPDLLSRAHEADPNFFYAEMRDNYPCYWHEGSKAFIVSRFEDVETLFKDKTYTSKNYEWQLEPVHGRTILQMEGREHSLHRGILTPAFRGSELMSKFVPIIEKNACDLIDRFRYDGKVDLVDQFTIRFPINVIVDMLGLNKSDHDRFQKWYHSIMSFLGNLSGDEGVTARGLQTRDELADYMLPIIESRRALPGEDLLSTLCTSEIDGERMTDIDIKAFVSLLLVAGGETTDKAMANMFANLIANPDQLEAVRNDYSIIDCAFAETLRHSPPVHMVMRQPEVDIEIHGVEIPAGSTVTGMVAAANRDPRQYSDPDSFNIFREDLDVSKAFTSGATHAAFGLGRHFCVGAMLAKVEVETGAYQLLDAMDDIAFDGGPPEPRGVFTRAPTSMPLRFKPKPRV